MKISYIRYPWLSRRKFISTLTSCVTDTHSPIFPRFLPRVPLSRPPARCLAPLVSPGSSPPASSPERTSSSCSSTAATMASPSPPSTAPPPPPSTPSCRSVVITCENRQIMLLGTYWRLSYFLNKLSSIETIRD